MSKTSEEIIALAEKRVEELCAAEGALLRAALEYHKAPSYARVNAQIRLDKTIEMYAEVQARSLTQD